MPFQTLTTPEILDWFLRVRKNCPMKVQEIAVRELRGWNLDPSGEITHQSGEFYRVMGVRVSSASREVDSWDQPLIHQKEMGILGILTVVLDETRYFLLHAKAEPGNTHIVQLSPTLQATFSNLKRVHGGKRTPFAQFFDPLPASGVLYKQWLAEDGGRFYAKSNLNVLLEISSEQIPEHGEDYCWMTLPQIKELLHQDNIVNPHVRSIIAHL